MATKSYSNIDKPVAVVEVITDMGEGMAGPPNAARDVKILSGVTVAGAVEIMPADAKRRGLTLRNDSDAKMYFRTDGEAGDGVGYPLDVGRGYSFEATALMPMNAISLWCAVAGKRWAALYSTDA